MDAWALLVACAALFIGMGLGVFVMALLAVAKREPPAPDDAAINNFQKE